MIIQPRAGTMNCCITVSFNVLPEQRVSFNVLPTQRFYPWDWISDGFVLPRDSQSLTDTRWVLMCHQHRFIILKRYLSWTRWIIRWDDCDDTTTNSRPLPPPMLNNVATTWDDDNDDGDDGGNDGREVLIVNQNDGDNGGVGLGIGLWRRAEQGRRPSSTSDLA